jgi:hypothetical protein
MIDKKKAFLAALLTVILAHPVFIYSVDWQKFSFAPSDKIVKNPECGFCFMPQLEPAEKMPAWLLNIGSIAYFRIDWADAVDASGNYQFDRLDEKVFSTYRKYGLRIAFRIMGANIHSAKRNVFPKDILNRAIPVSKKISVYGKEQEEPVFWNDAYINEHGKMIQALGGYIGKHTDIDYVDLGGMGEWGEMHLINWSDAELAKYGFSQEIYMNAVFRMMEQMERAMPETVKAFCVAPLDERMEPVFRLVADRAVKHGWWLRTDGFSKDGPPSYVKPYFEKYYRGTGFILEPAGGINRGFSGEPVPVDDYLKAILANRPSIVNLMGLWDLDKLTDSDKKTCESAGKKIGYRFQVKEVVIPKTIVKIKESGALLPIRITVSQNGGAYYFGQSVVYIKLTQGDKIVYEQGLVPVKPLSETAPGDKTAGSYFLNLPADTAYGITRVYTAIRDLKYGFLNPDNKDAGEDRFVYSGSLSIEDKPGDSPVLFELSKNGFPKTLKASGDIKISVSENGYSIKGVNQSDWSYAGAYGEAVPGYLYIMKARLRAWKGEIPDSRLFFKFGVHKKNWDWLKNVNSSEYDFLNQGTWQELTATYLVQSPEEAILLYSIEKGRNGPSSINAEISSWIVQNLELPPDWNSP